MEYINKIEIQGRIGAVKAIPASTYGTLNVYRLSVLTEHLYRMADGSTIVEPTWHDVQLVEKYMDELCWLEKGMVIHITGRLRNRKYIASDGSERQTFDIWADDFTVVE